MEKLPNLNGPKDSVQFLQSIDPRHFGRTVLNTKWLEAQPKDRLVRAIRMLATRLQTDPTVKIKKSDLPLTRRQTSATFKTPVAAIDEFIVPASMRGLTETPLQLWIMELERKDKSRQILRINILGHFTIGRKRSGSSVDLDLSAYDASKSGVSGRHAGIRVSPDELLLYDLESLNGTYYDWKRVEPTIPVKLNEGEDISFGKLVFVIRKIRKEY